MRTDTDVSNMVGGSLPMVLAPGDSIPLIAPAGRVNRDALDADAEALRARGSNVKMGAHVLDAYGHMAGTDRDRASALMNAFLNPKIKGIF